MPKQIEVPGCTGTTVSELKRAHGLQFLEVNIAHGGEVPLHTHKCVSTMIITRGSARKLTGAGVGVRVNPGDRIDKAANEPHGFTDVGEEGFQFISISDNAGIVHEDGSFDMTLA